MTPGLTSRITLRNWPMKEMVSSSTDTSWSIGNNACLQNNNVPCQETSDHLSTYCLQSFALSTMLHKQNGVSDPAAFLHTSIWNSVSLPTTAPNWQNWNHIWSISQFCSLWAWKKHPKKGGKDVKKANLKYHANTWIEFLLCFSIFSLFIWSIISSKIMWTLIK